MLSQGGTVTGLPRVSVSHQAAFAEECGSLKPRSALPIPATGDRQRIATEGSADMDIALESIRAFVAMGIFVFFLTFARRRHLTSQPGWWLVVVGFGLLAFGSVVDITDNFESLNKYVLIGDTDSQAIVEKVVGFLFGFLALAVGFWLWLPRMGAVAERHDEIRGHLEVAEEQFQVAFEHAPVAMILGRPDGTVVQVNPAACEMFGYSQEQFADLVWMDMTYPDDLDESRILMQQLLDGERATFDVEQRYVRSTGQILSGELRVGVVRDAQGRQLFHIAQIVDLTDLRDSYRRLEELIRSKDELVASVSHELRTPLTAVLGFAELLHDGQSELSSSERHEMVRSIARQAFDLSEIVEDLLLAARVELGELSVTKVPTDILEQIAQVIEAFDPNSTVGVRVSGDSVKAESDPIRVRQILRNLLSNAVRYGGENIQITVTSEDSTARVLVTDNGPGLRDEDQGLIFEAYYRAHNAASTPGSVGIGLTISRDLARLMQGDLTYRYEDGRSIFELTLPMVPSEPRADNAVQDDQESAVVRS